MEATATNDELKKELRALLFVTESIKNSFIEARYHGVSPAFINQLGYFIPIIQQLLLAQIPESHESEQFAAVAHLIGQCYHTLECVANRLTRAAENEPNGYRSLSLRSYIKEQLQDEIDDLTDMIRRNISAVATMLSIRSITRSGGFEIVDPTFESGQARRRSSFVVSSDLDNEEKPLLPKLVSKREAQSSGPRQVPKVVCFEPLTDLTVPPAVYPRQGPLGLSDAATNIEFLADCLDVESQVVRRNHKREGRTHIISFIGFLIFFSVSMVLLLYFGIKKHDVNSGVGIMGTLLSVYSVLDRAVLWWYRRRAVDSGSGL